MFNYQGDIRELREWATHRIANQEPPVEFAEYITDVLNSRYPVGEIGYWLGTTIPESKLSEDDPAWVDRYPHAHYISMGWPKDQMTAITYLSIPEEGGQFGLGGLSPDDEYQFIDIEEGLTLVCDGETWHGVRAVQRGLRLALVTAAMAL